VSKAWTGGSTRAWRRVRALVLARDGRLCRLQLAGCTTVATHVHHVRGKARGDDPAHLVAACAGCNLKVGDPTTYDPEPRSVTKW
jgi:5-methylcytosine-specific restriction endonuclease McrA